MRGGNERITVKELARHMMKGRGEEEGKREEKR